MVYYTAYSRAVGALSAAYAQIIKGTRSMFGAAVGGCILKVKMKSLYYL